MHGFGDILSKDAITFEGAYWGQWPPAELAVPKVLQAMAVHFDLYTRGKLIELLGECEDREVLPIGDGELRKNCTTRELYEM